MKKLRRTNQYMLQLEIPDPDFVRPPRDGQRNWILNRFLKEAAEDLEKLHELAAHFVPGGEPSDISEREHRLLDDEEIMEDWQVKVMKAMANLMPVGGDVLEIGFGRGIASDLLQSREPRSHTIVECHSGIFEKLKAWREARSDRDIRLLQGKWQDLTQQFETYDGVFFHTYPLSPEEFSEYVSRSATFAEHFFASAAAILKPGGQFTYLTNEIDSLSRGHQRALLKHFGAFTVRSLNDLQVPDETSDAQWAQETVLVVEER